MKIIQKIPLFPSDQFYYLDYFSGSLNYRIKLDLAHYSGKQSVYFKAQVEQFSTSTTVTIRLYNYTDSETIESWEITDKNIHDLVSVDLKALYATEKIIGVKVEKTTGNVNVFVRDGRLEITQDTTALDRQTETFQFLDDSIGSDYHQTFIDIGDFNFTVPIDKFDGTVEAIFQACVKCEGGVFTGKIRLYDVTADEAVADSQIDFYYATPTIIETTALTLIAGHEYRFQSIAWAAPNYFFVYLPVIKIHASAFTKCASIPISWMSLPSGSGGEEWTNQGVVQSFDKSKITGDVVTYQYRQSFGYYADSWVDHGVELYNNTLSALIAGTQHFYEGGERVSYSFIDTPTLPDSCDLIRALYGADDCWGEEPSFLFAFQEEAFVASGAIGPDSSQPTGYHCFMQNFIKNSLAGYVPLLTPDGVNRTW